MDQDQNWKNKSNVVLTGMCGAGKSTVGVLLAKSMNRLFIDTDVYIQALENSSLQDIIDMRGVDYFRQLEERHVMCIDAQNAVIATGGSVVYSSTAMKYLGDGGVIVYLDLPFEIIERRVTDLYTRGIVKTKEQTLKQLYDERVPLYRKFADVTIDCNGKTQQQIADEIAGILRK